MLKRVNFGQKLLLYLSREPPLSPVTTLLSLSQSNAENPKVYMMIFVEHHAFPQVKRIEYKFFIDQTNLSTVGKIVVNYELEKYA